MRNILDTGLFIWPEIQIPPINLYVMAQIQADFDAKIEIKERKTNLKQVNLSDLYAKRIKG